MDWRPNIEHDPKVLAGKPCIKGTRMSVELIVEDMASGASVDDLKLAYPFLTEAQVRAALAFQVRDSSFA